MQIEVIATPELGDRSYLVHDGTTALVIDPQRDLDRVMDVATRAGVVIEWVLETHIHNDYVTGGFELARATHARYAVNADDPVTFEREPVRDGDELTAGSLTVRVIATPGHTVTHLSFAIADSATPNEPPAVFTGGSLLYGSVGRTDLVGPDRTQELTHAQFHSARRLAAEFPDEAPVFPTHGFGSFCSSGAATGGDDSTIGVERGRNDALVEQDEDAFVERLVANLTAYPSYYVHMAPRNLQGPGPIDLSAPEPVDSGELAKRISAGEWVVDMRDRTVYAADHLAGTVSIALGQMFVTYLGWVIPWDSPLTLIADTPEQLAEAQRLLALIGIDRPSGAAAGSLDEIGVDIERREYPRVTFEQVMRDAAPSDVILDVRRDDERANGYIVDSAHIPLTDLVARLDDVPDGRLWVHCASGFRASIGASLLDRAGRDVVLIDDDYDKAAPAGLQTT